MSREGVSFSVDAAVVAAVRAVASAGTARRGPPNKLRFLSQTPAPEPSPVPEAGCIPGAFIDCFKILFLPPLKVYPPSNTTVDLPLFSFF